MSALWQSPLVALFALVAIGVTLGAVRVGTVSLGAAAVFFVAIVYGHAVGALPAAITDLGLVLFVYAVGLQAGPRFAQIVRDRGAAFLTVGVGSTVAGAVSVLLLATWLELPAHLAAGLYAGATTCTPALASAMDTLNRANPSLVDAASVAYGATYPFSVVSVVLFVQFLPRLMRRAPGESAKEYRLQEAAQTPPLTERVVRITNPNCAGRNIADLQSLHVVDAVICRVKQAGRLSPARPEIVLSLGDVVMAVGTRRELDKFQAFFGEIVDEAMYDPTGEVTSEQVVVSRRDAAGRTFGELCMWQRFGSVATRLRRDGVEMTPRGNLRLELGDVLRVVGSREGIARVAEAVGREERRLDQTSIVPFAAGIALGVAVGMIPISLGNGSSVHLGAGGGTFVVGLFMGHLGNIGPVRIYVPNAVKHFARELGLLLFLAGAGAGAGQQFVEVCSATGPHLFLAGAAVTCVTAGVAAALALGVFRWNLLYGAGALCACMTNPPGLAAASELADSDASAVGFASVYPVALITKIILAPVVFMLLK